jgi:hypothetical protein
MDELTRRYLPPNSPARRRTTEETAPPTRQGRDGGGRSLITLLGPNVQTVRAGFYKIAIPGSSAFTVGTNESAWYKLRSIEPVADGQIPTEFSLTGIRVEMASADVDGAGTASAGSAAAWGDVRGVMAAIVIGRRLPGAVGVWTSAPCYIAGIEDAANNVVPAGAPDYIFETGFPSGKWSDTTPGKGLAAYSYSPDQIIFPQGYGALDVSLVVRGTQIQTASASSLNLFGLARVGLQLRLAKDRYAFTQGG